MDSPVVYPVRFSCALLAEHLAVRHVTVTLEEDGCRVDVDHGGSASAHWTGPTDGLGEALRDLVRTLSPAATA